MAASPFAVSTSNFAFRIRRSDMSETYASQRRDRLADAVFDYLMDDDGVEQFRKDFLYNCLDLETDLQKRLKAVQELAHPFYESHDLQSAAKESQPLGSAPPAR